MQWTQTRSSPSFCWWEKNCYCIWGKLSLSPKTVRSNAYICSGLALISSPLPRISHVASSAKFSSRYKAACSFFQPLTFTSGPPILDPLFNQVVSWPNWLSPELLKLTWLGGIHYTLSLHTLVCWRSFLSCLSTNSTFSDVFALLPPSLQVQASILQPPLSRLSVVPQHSLCK